jgi:hypothetical protein
LRFYDWAANDDLLIANKIGLLIAEGALESQMSIEPATLADRLGRIEKFETELMHKAAASASREAAISHTDMFVMGAVRRTLAQSQGFRDLLAARNFPCAAGLLRMQIDTAMRVNALTLVAERDDCCKALLGGAHFNKMKDADGKKLTDAYLRQKLAEQHPWITPVYEQTSDFIHLSGRHLYNSIASLDEKTRTVRFVISGKDPPRPDETYFEILDSFFEATKIVGLLLLGYFDARALQFGRKPG